MSRAKFEPRLTGNFADTIELRKRQANVLDHQNEKRLAPNTRKHIQSSMMALPDLPELMCKYLLSLYGRYLGSVAGRPSK